jgi:hypothetical protein
MTINTLTRILPVCILLAVASAGAALASDIWARTMWPRSMILPPPEFDRPYDGKLIVTRVKTPDEIKAKCPEANYGAGTPLGCARTPPSLAWCEIYLLPDKLIAAYNVDPEHAMRHELAHCSGWIHD